MTLLAVLFFVRGKWRSVNGRHGVVAAGFSALLALGVAQLLADWVSRPRPYVAHAADAHLFIARSADPSFPSDHATAAFAIAVALLLRHRKAGILALGLAVLVSVGRVAVGTHYPTDVLAGAAIGALAALIIWHRAVRGPLHRLAEWAGTLYERLTAVRFAPSRPQVPSVKRCDVRGSAGTRGGARVSPRTRPPRRRPPATPAPAAGPPR